MQVSGYRPVVAHVRVVREDVLGQTAEEPQAPRREGQADRQVQPELLAGCQASEQPTKLGVVALPDADHGRVGDGRLTVAHEPRPVARHPALRTVGDHPLTATRTPSRSVARPNHRSTMARLLPRK